MALRLKYLLFTETTLFGLFIKFIAESNKRRVKFQLFIIDNFDVMTFLLTIVVIKNYRKKIWIDCFYDFLYFCTGLNPSVFKILL